MNESAYFIAKRVDGRRDTAAIKQKLDTLHGVTSVSVNPQNNLICVDYDSAGISYDKIENCLNKLGYQIAADASTLQSR